MLRLTRSCRGQGWDRPLPPVRYEPCVASRRFRRENGPLRRKSRMAYLIAWKHPNGPAYVRIRGWEMPSQLPTQSLPLPFEGSGRLSLRHQSSALLGSIPSRAYRANPSFVGFLCEVVMRIAVHRRYLDCSPFHLRQPCPSSIAPTLFQWQSHLDPVAREEFCIRCWTSICRHSFLGRENNGHAL